MEQISSHRDITLIDDLPSFSTASNNNNIPFRAQRPVKKPITCMEVVEHIDSCPLCSRHYTIDLRYFWFAIIVLTILLILFAKKALYP